MDSGRNPKALLSALHLYTVYTTCRGPSTTFRQEFAVPTGRLGNLLSETRFRGL